MRDAAIEDDAAPVLRARVSLMRELGVDEWDPSTGRIKLGLEPREPALPMAANDEPDAIELKRRDYEFLLKRAVSREEVERHLP